MLNKRSIKKSIIATSTEVEITVVVFEINSFLVGQIILLLSATKSLKKAAIEVYNPLVNEDMTEARKYVSYIVGRDTQSLDEKGIIKATVETVAENTTDGIVAPLLFMIIGGAPLGFLYKGINTMDSMVGYKNDKYILFGRCAAKLDDFANFIPARLTAITMIVSAFILRYNGKNALKIYLRDRKNHKSPNSAQTESVVAGALGIELAGDASYFNTIMKKPTIGDKIRESEPTDIMKTINIMYTTVVIVALLCATVRISVCYFA
ncbi:MAG: cobalamin biosynthesis protein CobD [Epulopiscium sp. Nuni2H_MBin003]|nr:MAG: cobalamin biosynthesis protein CobD [Epulopiscium sp. Nuni2H_MBin003]